MPFLKLYLLCMYRETRIRLSHLYPTTIFLHLFGLLLTINTTILTILPHFFSSGKVTGNTIFNVLRLGEVETGGEGGDRPLEELKIKGIEVLWNPFDDIVPRWDWLVNWVFFMCVSRAIGHYCFNARNVFFSSNISKWSNLFYFRFVENIVVNVITFALSISI